MKNIYAHHSRVSEKKIREIVRYFAADLTALQAARLSGLNRNTVNHCLTGHVYMPERVILPRVSGAHPLGLRGTTPDVRHH